MIDAIAESAIADMLVWVSTGMAAATLSLVVFLVRVTLQNKRVIQGEDSIDSDNGLVGMVEDHEQRIEAHDRMLAKRGFSRPDDRRKRGGDD